MITLMNTVNLAAVDVNLLVVLEALLDEAHVRRAGERVGLSQPAATPDRPGCGRAEPVYAGESGRRRGCDLDEAAYHEHGDGDLTRASREPHRRQAAFAPATCQSTSTERIIALVFPVAALVVVGDLHRDHVFRVLETELCRHPD